MSRKTKVPKGILGVPRRVDRQVFVFGRFAEGLPSDDSDDSDFDPGSDEETESTNTASASAGTKKKRKDQNDSKQKKLSKKPKPRPVCTNNKVATGTLQKKRSKKQTDSRKQKFAKKAETESSANNKDVVQGQVGNAATASQLTRGWSELIPTELLLLIFQNVLNSSSGSTIPFLCRMSKVCRRWREVASEPVLWRKVDLSMSSFQFLRATTATIERLAPTRLTAVTELSLSEWNKLTDKALEAIGKHCPELQSIVLSHCESLTSGAIASLADKCHQLKMIDIAFTKIDISGLQHMTTVLGRQLEKLCVTNCTRLRGQSILPLIQEHCPNLTFLDVSSTNIRALNIEKLQAGCPKLKELFLVNLLLNSTPECKTLNNDKRSNGFPQLENLGLPCGYIGNDHRTDKFLYRILWASHNLKVLDIRGPNRFSSEVLRRLPATSLEQLYLTKSASSFSKVAAIIEKWHHSLKVLDLSMNKYVEDEHMELLQNFGMPKLHTLDLNNTNVTGNGVRSVVNGCPNLRDLNLSSCRGVPRGIKQRHQGEALRNLSQRLVDIELLESDGSE